MLKHKSMLEEMPLEVNLNNSLDKISARTLKEENVIKEESAQPHREISPPFTKSSTKQSVSRIFKKSV